MEAVTKLYFVLENSNESQFRVLRSFPFTTFPNVCIIFGHNHEVLSLLKKTPFLEQEIYIISCDVKDPRGFRLPKKNTYISIQTNGQTRLYVGEEYGFDFDITESELILYNNRNRPLQDALQRAFSKV
jgi:hypothetical protein